MDDFFIQAGGYSHLEYLQNLTCLERFIYWCNWLRGAAVITAHIVASTLKNSTILRSNFPPLGQCGKPQGYMMGSAADEINHFVGVNKMV